jgi:hypothetical protein
MTQKEKKLTPRRQKDYGRQTTDDGKKKELNAKTQRRKDKSYLFLCAFAALGHYANYFWPWSVVRRLSSSCAFALTFSFMTRLTPAAPAVTL